MGHDITGFYRKEVAYLRRNAFADFDAKNRIYAALGVEEHNGGVGGDGYQSLFTEEELRKAMDKLTSFVHVEKDEIKFLKDCMKVAKKRGYVEISFC